MTRLYLRWSALVVVAAVIAFLASRSFDRHLASLAPEDVVSRQPVAVVRVIGLVTGGTLTGDAAAGHARFDLAGSRDMLPVQYDGPPPDNLRELKTLVVVGRWDPASAVFLAHDIALVTNYGFVVGAYLAGFIPLAFFLFAMERRVTLLYREIKQSRLYEPEKGDDVDPR